jgi:hypothetical protein
MKLLNGMSRKIFIAFILALICLPAFAGEVEASSSQWRVLSEDIARSGQQTDLAFKLISLAVAAAMGYIVWRIHKSSLPPSSKRERSVACILFSVVLLIMAFVKVSSCMTVPDPGSKTATSRTAC